MLLFDDHYLLSKNLMNITDCVSRNNAFWKFSFSCLNLDWGIDNVDCTSSLFSAMHENVKILNGFDSLSECGCIARHSLNRCKKCEQRDVAQSAPARNGS